MRVAQGHTVDGQGLAFGQVAQRGLGGGGRAQAVVDLAHAHTQGARCDGGAVVAGVVGAQAGQLVVAGQPAVAAIGQREVGDVLVAGADVAVTEFGAAVVQGFRSIQVAQGQLAASQAVGAVVSLVGGQGQRARCDGQASANGEQLIDARTAVQGGCRRDRAGDGVRAHVHAGTAQCEIDRLA